MNHVLRAEALQNGLCPAAFQYADLSVDQFLFYSAVSVTISCVSSDASWRWWR